MNCNLSIDTQFLCIPLGGDLIRTWWHFYFSIGIYLYWSVVELNDEYE